MKQRKITKTEQKVAASILTQFMFTKTMEDVIQTWKELYDKYELEDDPFTNTPCTPEEYCKNRLGGITYIWKYVLLKQAIYCIVVIL